MNKIFKFFLLLLVLQGYFKTGYCQQGSIGTYSSDEEIAWQVTKAKEKAEAAKILILGNSAHLSSGLWLQLANQNFIDQCNTLKHALFTNAYFRKCVINDANLEVLGRPAPVNDFAEWDAKISREQKDWYITIVSAYRVTYNNSRPAREWAVKNAYKEVFGRQPTSQELGYWVDRKVNYRLIYLANLHYLYSADGTEELPETVKRAYNYIHKKYTNVYLQQTIAIAKNKRLNFEEIILNSK